MEDDERSVSHSEDSRETVKYCDRETRDHDENDLSDLSNGFGRSNNVPGLNSQSLSLNINRESAIADLKEVEKRSKPDTPLTTITDIQIPMVSIRNFDELGLMNGSKEAVDKQECNSPSSIEQQNSSPAKQQLAHQLQYPAISSFSLQSSDRAPTINLKQSFGSPSKIIGSGVVISPMSQSKRVPQLPSCIQLSKRHIPPASEGPEAKEKRQGVSPPKVKLPSSITLVPRTPPKTQNNFENLLANRGITVVTSPSSRSQPGQLNSAVSITRSPLQQRIKAEPEPTSLGTIDLTKESKTPRFLNRAVRSLARSVCQVCDKVFSTAGELSQHMACHLRTSGRFECGECRAQYATEAALQGHRQKYHGAGGPSPDMALPVVDLKQPGVLAKLTQLGIRSVIPLSQLHSGSGGGMFGLPVVALDSASNPAICNIGDLGASNLLPMGPLKNLSFNNNMC